MRATKNVKTLLPTLLRPWSIWRYVRAEETPLLPKLVFFAAMAYVVMPLDLIPDIAPVLSWLDDVGVATAAMTWITMQAGRREKAGQLTAGKETAPVAIAG